MTATYPRPEDDARRLTFLSDLAILDTAPDENLDRIVGLCRSIFDMPVAVVSLVDEERQWFKSIQGLDVCETDRDVAFCNYTIMSDDIFEVTDASTHPDFSDNELVTGEPHIRYYAGAPFSFDGFRLGAVCLIDSRTRSPLTERERSILKGLSAVVEREIRTQRLLRESLEALISYIKGE